MAEKPVVRGLHICEQVIVEEGSRNVSLINCFTRLLVDGFPSKPHRFVLFAVFANGQGSIPVTLEVLDLESASTVYSRVLPVEFHDPLQEVRFMFRMVDLVFTRPGRFEINLIIEGESVAQTSFEIQKRWGLRMREHTDSFNCVDVVLVSSDFPPAEPSPRSPAYEAHIQKQRELYLRSRTNRGPDPIIDVSSDAAEKGPRE